MVLIFFVLLLSYLNTYLGKEIILMDPTLLKNRSHIDFAIPSYSVGVVANYPVLDMFNKEESRIIATKINKKAEYYWPGETRGIPPSNWAKFLIDDTSYGLFTYKTLHRCNNMGPKVQRWIYDIVGPLHTGNKDNRIEGTKAFKTRLASGPRKIIHSVTTQIGEIYDVNLVDNMTTSHRTESDVRVIPIPKECRNYISNKMKFYNDNINMNDNNDNNVNLLPTLLLTGSYMHEESFWRETQFMAIAGMDVNQQIRPIKSWTLEDTEGKMKKRRQKNWIPFFVINRSMSSTSKSKSKTISITTENESEIQCHLYLSKRYAPIHEVAEFTSWNAPSSTEVAFDPSISITTSSPAQVSNRYTIRGSAPPISHPLLRPGYLLGCVHVRGRIKVYRHALYIMKSTSPFDIVSFSGLFVFNPFRNIEFVTSLFIDPYTNHLQLTHGSSDCEARLAIYPVSQLRKDFGEYMIRQGSSSYENEELLLASQKSRKNRVRRREKNRIKKSD